jgi:tryptophanyl-tRNA synthetase
MTPSGHIVLTGDRTTGPLHIGHYVGSLRNRVALQDRNLQFLLLADLQAMTDNANDVERVRRSVVEVAIDYLAVGIDPRQSTICVQSALPALCELTAYLMNYVTVARLERNPTIKEEIRVRGFERDIPAGFLCYPVAQAADITAFKADLVPVGDDQLPMIEQTNELVRRINRLAGHEVLVEAAALTSGTGRLPGFDGKAKMSKSQGNALLLSASRSQIEEGVKAMYTDPDHLRVSDVGRVEGNVVFTYLDAFDDDPDEVAALKAHYRRGGLGDIVLKRRLADKLEQVIAPIRERRAAIAGDRSFVMDVIRDGTFRARAVTAETVAELKDSLGVFSLDERMSSAPPGGVPAGLLAICCHPSIGRPQMTDTAQPHLVHPRDQGLVRAIGPLSLTANVVNYTIGASIFVMPAVVAATAGSWALVAFAIAAASTFALTICFAEAAARVPTSGGQAGFTEVAFGRYAGFLVGALTYVANLLAAGAITAAAADMVTVLAPAAGSRPVRAAMILVWVTLLALVNLRGVGQAARLLRYATVVKMAPLLLFLVVGICFLDPNNFTLPALPVADGLGQATLLAVFLFAGVHGPLLAGGEVRDPARTFPVALLAGMAVVTLVFIGAQLIAQGLLGPDLPASSAPLADALGRISPLLGQVMIFGALASMLSWTASDALSTPRSLFALARDGMLPSRLSRLRPKGSPSAAILVHLGLVAALSIVGGFASLAAICSVVLVLLFLSATTAAVLLRVRGVALGGPVRELPGLWIAALVGTAVSIWVGAQAALSQILGLATLIAMLSLWFAVAVKRRAPRSAGS